MLACMSVQKAALEECRYHMSVLAVPGSFELEVVLRHGRVNPFSDVRNARMPLSQCPKDGSGVARPARYDSGRRRKV